MPSRFDSLRLELPRFRLGAFVLAALAVHVVSAWNNGGFLHADEHYQIIEFAQYKLTRQSAGALAWEYAATIRPALQPWIAAGAIRLGNSIGVESPFAIAFALRMVSALLSLWMSLELCARIFQDLTSRALRLLALFVSCFFWITPTVEGRFSSENWGGALLVAGLCLMLDASQAGRADRAKGALLAVGAGLIWSAAFYCRFQIGVAIAGSGLWLLVMRRAPLPLLITIAASFVVGCGMNEILDHWLYGRWTLVPYNYFTVNLAQGRAATFGVLPWWMIVVYFGVVLILPYSLALMTLLVAGWWYGRRELLVWTLVPFVLVHGVIAHKEPRFLIPVLYFIGPLLALSIQVLPDRASAALSRWLRSPWGRANVLTWCTLNVVMMCVAIAVPANDTYRLDLWAWEQTRHGRLTLYAVDESLTHSASGLSNSFYRNPNLTIVVVTTADQLRLAVQGGPAFVYYRGVEPPGAVNAVGTCAPILRTFPEWLARIPPTVLDVHVATVCRLEPTRSTNS